MDDAGQEVPNTEVAERHARLLAWELAKNASPGANIGSSVVVTDDHAHELLRVPLHGITEPRQQ